MGYRRGWMNGALALVVGLCVAACGDADKDDGGSAVQPLTSEGRPPTTKGYALAIGLAEVDPDHYDGWSGPLGGCEPDAKEMKRIAEKQGLATSMLLTAAATRKAVLDKLAHYASTLVSGDLLVVSYSGHGGGALDQNGDEADRFDETWCLYDGQLLDDELAMAWSRFAEGVRILVFSDSCHSGTVILLEDDFVGEVDSSRLAELAAKFERTIARRGADIRDGNPTEGSIGPGDVGGANTADPDRPGPGGHIEPRRVVRAAPPGVLIGTHENNRAFYERIGREAKREDEVEIAASVILISGCQDDESSWDLGDQGLFTSELMKTWKDGAYRGGHHDFYTAIRKAVSREEPTQVPNYMKAGKPDDAFEKSRPYTLK